MRERAFRLTLAILAGYLILFVAASWLATYCTPEACAKAAQDVSRYLSALLAVPAVRLMLGLF